MNRVRLERMTNKDDELIKIAIWRNDCLESLRTPFKTPVDSYQQRIWLNNMDEYKDNYFFIYHDNEFIGYCGLDKICRINKTAEMSLLIGTPFYHMGFGEEAAISLLEYGFGQLGLQLIYIEVYETTEKYRGFWKKLGFKGEGRLRRRKYWQGKFYDSIVASILNTEFKRRKK